MSKRKTLQKSTWALRAKKALSIGSDIATDIMKLRDKPKITDYVSLGMRGAQSIISRMESEIYDYFDDWHRIDDITFKQDIITAIQKFPTEQVGGHDTHAIMISDVYGEEIGWIRKSPADGSTKQMRTGAPIIFDGPWIDGERYDEAFNVLGRAMWEHVNMSKVLVGGESTLRYDKQESRITLRPDRDIDNDVHESKKGVEIFERIKKFYDAGENRSVVLMGPPGTGKTTIMKYIASRFGKHTMRINVAELREDRSETVVAAVQLLKPEVLLIDDFDRFSHGFGQLLTQLEQVNKAVRVFVVSVNDIMRLDPAVIRPGRFDEIVEICEIDDAAIERLVAGLPENVRGIMRRWPISYIVEFSKRYRVLGVETALREVAELKYRVEKINNAKYEGFKLGDDTAKLEEAISSFINNGGIVSTDFVEEDD